MIYLLGFFIALFAFYWILASSIISPPRRVSSLSGDLIEVNVPTLGKQTSCFATPGVFKGEGKVVFVLAHGIHGSRNSWTPIMEQLERQGYQSIAVSMPGHDASPFEQVGFGELESNVLVDVVLWVRKKYGPSAKVVLGGFSLGGSSAWLASAKTKEIDGIFTDCAFGRFDQAVHQWFRRKLGSAGVVMTPVIWIARARTGLDPASIRPEDAARQWNGKPALVIQSGGDTLITPDQGRRLSEAAGADYWEIPNVEHVRGYQENPEAYINRLVRFVDVFLK